MSCFIYNTQVLIEEKKGIRLGSIKEQTTFCVSGMPKIGVRAPPLAILLPSHKNKVQQESGRKKKGNDYCKLLQSN